MCQPGSCVHTSEDTAKMHTPPVPYFPHAFGQAPTFWAHILAVKPRFFCRLTFLTRLTPWCLCRVVRSADGTLCDLLRAQICYLGCIAQHPNYTHFGLQFKWQCWCAEGFNAADEVSAEGECGLPCTGNADQDCGGNQRMLTYKIISE